MARIYQSGVKRTVKTKYDVMIKLKPLAMKHLQKMTTNNGTVAQFNTLDENNIFKYKKIYHFVPFFDQDPFTPVALTYPILMPVSDPSNTEELGWGYLDDTVYRRYNEKGDIEYENVHGLGVLPIVFTHKVPQTKEFFVEGATDIADANEQVNVLMTELGVGSRYQLWGQPWIEGLDD